MQLSTPYKALSFSCLPGIIHILKPHLRSVNALVEVKWIRNCAVKFNSLESMSSAHGHTDSHTKVLVSLPSTLHRPSPFAEVVFLLHRQNLLALHLPLHCYTLKSKSDEWLCTLAVTVMGKKHCVMNFVSVHGYPLGELYQISWMSSQVKPSSMGKEEESSFTRGASD